MEFPAARSLASRHHWLMCSRPLTPKQYFAAQETASPCSFAQGYTPRSVNRHFASSIPSHPFTLTRIRYTSLVSSSDRQWRNLSPARTCFLPFSSGGWRTRANAVAKASYPYSAHPRIVPLPFLPERRAWNQATRRRGLQASGRTTPHPPLSPKTQVSGFPLRGCRCVVTSKLNPCLTLDSLPRLHLSRLPSGALVTAKESGKCEKLFRWSLARACSKASAVRQR